MATCALFRLSFAQNILSPLSFLIHVSLDLFFFLNGQKFLGQGLNPSHSCDLQFGWDNAGSLTHSAKPGTEHTPPQQPRLLKLDS